LPREQLPTVIQRNHPKSRRGASLVEMMTVVAILLVLAAILTSVFASGKERAKIAADINNLRQIGAAAALYAGQNDDVFPLTLRDLLNAKAIPEAVCVSAFDQSAGGWMAHWMIKFQGTVNKAVLESKWPRCSYVGPGEGNWSWDTVQRRIIGRPAAGWLFNAARLVHHVPAGADPKKINPLLVPELGPYQRLTFEGSVLRRHMTMRPLVAEDGIVGPTLVFADYFADVE
jgi:prepilin-type N-terminal cleavage/methylation domain-containing protein